MTDKNSILNNIVEQAADLMEMKISYNESVLEMLKAANDPSDAERIRLLEKLNKDTAEAVKLMRTNAGCWA